MPSGTRLGRSSRSEVNNPRQLDFLIAVVKSVEANWP